MPKTVPSSTEDAEIPAQRPRFGGAELVIGIVLFVLVAGGAWWCFRQFLHPRQNLRSIATQAKVIHGWLVTYANEHGGVFPTGSNANEAYRELFKSDMGADEMQFWIRGDAYHRFVPRGEPDGDIGRAPDRVQALERGENAFAYVSGLTTADTFRLPLIANGFTSQPGIWSRNPNEKGGVFQGRYGVVCRVGGSAAVHELKDGEWMVKEKMNGQEVNIFTPGFEDANFTVVNPL